MSTEFVKGQSTNITHAFFTRHGGFSQGPFESLNVGKHVGDDAAKVDQNRRIALEAIGHTTDKFVFLGKLEHSNGIQQVDAAAGGLELSEHDALITNTPGLAIGLSVADCLPVILVDETAPALGIVHGGWRGLKVDVMRHTVEALVQQFGANSQNIKAIIGPSISQQSYQVGEELRQHFDKRYFSDSQKPHLDLWSIAEDQLNAAGVNLVENLKIDNFQDERFYSHRRSGGKTGRFLAVASL